MPDDLSCQILEHCADALIYADHAGTIARWNAAAERVCGWSAAQAVGQSLDLIIPEHLRAAHWAGYQRAMRSGQLHLQGKATLTRSLHASGAKLYVEMSFAVVRDANGQPLGSVAMARDVSARVAQEKTASAAKTPKTAS